MHSHAETDAAPPVVLHIPHASTYIPPDVCASLLLTDAELADELLRLTDHFTDELFGGAVPGATEVVYQVSRLVADPERFEDDAREPAAAQGIGVIYMRGSRGQRLRNALTAQAREEMLERFYRPHHRRLAAAVDRQLARCGRCIVIDCHSFPREPLPTERSGARPDICIGTDFLHTPAALRDAALRSFRAEGFRVLVDQPFAGGLLPARHHGRDARVGALMIEVGRWLYMDEACGCRTERFEQLRAALGRCLVSTVSSWMGAPVA